MGELLIVGKKLTIVQPYLRDRSRNSTIFQKYALKKEQYSMRSSIIINKKTRRNLYIY